MIRRNLIEFYYHHRYKLITLIIILFYYLFHIIHEANIFHEIQTSWNTNTSMYYNAINHNNDMTNTSFTSWINKYRERPWYNKTCYFEYDSVPTGLGVSYDVSIFYHIGMLRGWRAIMLDQLHTLEICGLGYIASDITITFANPLKNESEHDTIQILTDILHQFPFIKNMINNNNNSRSTTIDQRQHQQNRNNNNLKFIDASNAFPYERLAMENMRSVCHQMINNTSTSSKSNISSSDDDNRNNINKKIVFYFHNKGASKYVEMTNDTKTKEQSEEIYDNIFHWRKYMEWFIFEKPTLCIRAHIQHQAKTCGVDLRQWYWTHYSGNFWSASCHHIIQLPMEIVNCYNGAEYWITNYTIHKGNSQPTIKEYINLFQLPYDLYHNKSSLNKYQFIISQKTFIQMNHTYSNKKQWDNGYPTGNQTDLWMNYLNGINEKQQKQQHQQNDSSR